MNSTTPHFTPLALAQAAATSWAWASLPRTEIPSRVRAHVRTGAAACAIVCVHERRALILVEQAGARRLRVTLLVPALGGYRARARLPRPNVSDLTGALYLLVLEAAADAARGGRHAC